jgi:hypothetical protein
MDLKIQEKSYGIRDMFKPYGLIEPKDDYIFNLEDGKDIENLYGKNLNIHEQGNAKAELKIINYRCKNPANPDIHLAKGFFQPNGDYDPSKKTFIISVTSDPVWDLEDLLKALDAYFRMDNTEVKTITDHFNVIVAWSATMIDTYKTLQLVKQQLGDKFEEAKSLFISGRRLHHGSADFFTDQPDISNPDPHSVAKNMFGPPESGEGKKKFCFIESSAINARGQNWQNGKDSLIQEWGNNLQDSITKLSRDPSFMWDNVTRMGKLKDGLKMPSIISNNFTLKDISGIHVPVQAAARSLEIIQGSSAKSVD